MNDVCFLNPPGEEEEHGKGKRREEFDTI